MKTYDVYRNGRWLARVEASGEMDAAEQAAEGQHDVFLAEDLTVLED